MYNRLNIIIEVFENRIFESKYCPKSTVDNDLSDGEEWNLLPASDYESHENWTTTLKLNKLFWDIKLTPKLVIHTEL